MAQYLVLAKQYNRTALQQQQQQQHCCGHHVVLVGATQLLACCAVVEDETIRKGLQVPNKSKPRQHCEDRHAALCYERQDYVLSCYIGRHSHILTTTWLARGQL